MSNFTMSGLVTGVYALVFVPSGASYIGASKSCIRNRIGWHLTKLRSGTHPSVYLQETWDDSVESDWRVDIIDDDPETEYDHQRVNQYPLNMRDARGYTLSSETRSKQSLSRAWYLETDGARESLSDRAKMQHADGNFGRVTWK